MGVRVIYCLTLVVLLLGTIRGEGSVMDYFKLRKSLTILQSTVEKLKGENQELAEEIRKISNSPAYARKVLRDKYHVTDPDEKIIFFAD
ncbi:MAG: septum formation initiator family protein [Proteobacteria bacterium]|nr:septum formation initiator family protein [Pseudomonadota bacterium]